jgi:hypothetical protein
MSSDDFPTTEELKAVQVERSETEKTDAMEAIDVGDDAANRAHGRRAEKADYLAEKLDEQAEALDE